MKIKVLLIIPSLVEGGAERVLINLLKHFDYGKYEVELCVVLNEGIYFDEIPSEVKVTTLFNHKTISRAFTFLYTKFNFKLLYKIIANLKLAGNYDVGVSFLDSSFTDILFFLKKKVKRKITWVHSSYQSYNNFNKYYKGRYKKRIITDRYSKLDSIIFVSEDSKKEFEHVFGLYPNMEVLYNVLDVQSVLKKSIRSQEIAVADNCINVVAMGSLFPVKGYDKLISVAGMLMEEGYSFKIRILGSGYLMDELQSQIQTLGVADYVDLLGFKSNPYPLLKASDIFIMTSVSEALPTALCEAMVLGLPAVVTDCSGCREIAGHGEFGIVTPQTVEGIYLGLKDMIVDKKKREFYHLKSLERAKIFNDGEIIQRVYDILDGKNLKDQT